MGAEGAAGSRAFAHDRILPQGGAVVKRIVLAWLAGFLATLVFHQPVLWLLHAAGVTPRTPYNMKAVPPLHVPSVISLAFWGGVWGIIMILALARVRRDAAYYL